MKYSLTILSLLFIVPVFAQQKAILTEVSIRQNYPVDEYNQLVQLEFIIKADLTDFTYQLNKDKTGFTEIKDDTGYDLLKGHMEYEEKMKSQGYSYNSMEIVYSGPVEGGIMVRCNIAVTPKPGAKTIDLIESMMIGTDPTMSITANKIIPAVTISRMLNFITT